MKTALLAPALLLAAASVLAQGPSTLAADDQQPGTPPQTRSFDASAIDKTADPCTDFFQYACGNWVKNNPIPGDQVRWGSFNMLAERNRYYLWQELDAASKNPKTPLQKKYGDFYAACMDTDLIDKKGLDPLKPALDRVASLSDPKQIA